MIEEKGITLSEIFNSEMSKPADSIYKYFSKKIGDVDSGSLATIYILFEDSLNKIVEEKDPLPAAIDSFSTGKIDK